MRTTPRKIAGYIDKVTYIEYLNKLLADYCEKYRDAPDEPWVVEDNTFSIRDLLDISYYCTPKGDDTRVDLLLTQLARWQKAEVFDLIIQGKEFEAENLMTQHLINSPKQTKLKICLVKFIGKCFVREAVTKYADSVY